MLNNKNILVSGAVKHNGNKLTPQELFVYQGQSDSLSPKSGELLARCEAECGQHPGATMNTLTHMIRPNTSGTELGHC